MRDSTSLLTLIAVVLMAGALAAPAAMAGEVVMSDVELIAIDYDSGNLFSVSPDTGIIEFLADPGIDDTNFSSLELGPDGFLYTVTAGITGNIYRIDPSDFGSVTASSLDISALSVIGEGSLVFAPPSALLPSGGTFATNGGVGTSAILYQIVDETATAVGVMDGGRRDINGMGVRSDGMFVGLDWVSNSLILIDPTDASTSPLMDVPDDVGTVGGMVIIDGEVGYFTTAALEADVPGSQKLYRFDPFGIDPIESVGFLEPASPSGATIAQRGFGGLAIVPEPASISVLALGGLALLRRRRAFRQP